MSFEWMERTLGRPDGAKLRAQVAALEVAERAGTLFRLGFTQAEATSRLIARVAWEYDPPAKHGAHKRPPTLGDAEVSKIVADTYARRPGGW